MTMRWMQAFALLDGEVVNSSWSGDLTFCWRVHVNVACNGGENTHYMN